MHNANIRSKRLQVERGEVINGARASTIRKILKQ
jgi:hypothetical protein